VSPDILDQFDFLIVTGYGSFQHQPATQDIHNETLVCWIPVTMEDVIGFSLPTLSRDGTLLCKR